MPRVQAGEADAGLIIHESRFTYQDFGLQCLADLGDWWGKTYKLPVPLGGIVARRALGDDKIKEFESALKESVAWAQSFDWRDDSEFADFIHQHAKEFEAEVLDSHIKTYVNKESIELSAEGLAGITEMFSQSLARGLQQDEFLST